MKLKNINLVGEPVSNKELYIGKETYFVNYDLDYKSYKNMYDHVVSKVYKTERDVRFIPTHVNVTTHTVLIVSDKSLSDLSLTEQESYIHDLRGRYPKLHILIFTNNMYLIGRASKDAVFYKLYKDEDDIGISEPMISLENMTYDRLVTSPLIGSDTMLVRNVNKQCNRRIGSDDYIYDIIHQKIHEQIQSIPATREKEILDIIEAEFKKEFGE